MNIAHLERDGVTRDDEQAMFGGTEDSADTRAFARCGQDDRHHFRFIVAPEDGAELTDLKAFTRDLVAQMEQDLPAPFAVQETRRLSCRVQTKAVALACFLLSLLRL